MPVGTAYIIGNKSWESRFTVTKLKTNSKLRLLRSKDPTRTIVLRKAFVADVNRRYRELDKVIWESIVTNDCFGLEESNVVQLFPAVELNAIPDKAFKFMRDEEKVNAFMKWLEVQEEKGVLEVIQRPGSRRGEEAWSDKYVRSSYQKGLAQAQADLIRDGIDIAKIGIGDAIKGAFNQPFHLDRVGLIYTRTFNELKGITKTMDGYISRELALGMASGEGAEAIARRIRNKVKSIGVNRSRLIARTEVVQTHGEAKLNELEAQEVYLDETIYVQWWSALDERVRFRHGPHGGRHGKVYTRDEGRALLGEPNCRCSLKPFIESIHGSKKSARKRAIEEHGKGDTLSPADVKKKSVKKRKEEADTIRKEKAKKIREELKRKNK